MTILKSTIDDIPEIFRLYALATDFQKKAFPDNTWPQFERELIETEISEARQFKLILNDQIACVWAIAYSDPQIWEERNNDPSIYIHRIATNPEFRGRGLVAAIVAWAKDHATLHHKKFIRMDTCGNNLRLIDHYKKCGFDFLGAMKLQNTAGLPTHYRDADVCLFQIQLEGP